MNRRYAFLLIAVIISAVPVYQQAAAKEDTAQITLKKTAVSKKNVYTYVVKKGDILSTIVRNIPGITEEYVANDYKLIKEINPNVADFNNLSAGQSLILPGKPLTISKEKKVKSTAAVSSSAKVNPKASPAKSRYYKVKNGDTLMKIMRRELKIETSFIKTIKIIKSINPSIRNINKIYPGTVIKLPGKTIFVKTPTETKTVEKEAIKPPENIIQPKKIIEVKEKKVMPLESRLTVLRHIITQMNGSIITTGNYYLPIPKTGQVTIDCSKIPVIEFDDNTTVFLDLENRAHNNLQKMISDNWANYYLVKVDKNDDIISTLVKVINTSKSYRMTKREKPMMIGALPRVEVIVDWVIVNTLPKQAQPVMQGLLLVDENSSLLPKSIKNYSQKNGLIITEISRETGIVGKPEEIYTLPPIPIFPTTSAKDFSYALVSYLGLSADKDVEIQMFDTVKDGFNLSIKADVLIKNNDKKYIVYSQNMSQQFVNALKQGGAELIFVNDKDAPKITMEKILRGLNISFSSNYFTFTGLDKNKAPYALSFNGTKIKTDKDLYVIDFDIDQELRGLLQEVWSANIAKY